MSRYLINGDINYSIGILSAARTTANAFICFMRQHSDTERFQRTLMSEMMYN